MPRGDQILKCPNARPSPKTKKAGQTGRQAIARRSHTPIGRDRAEGEGQMNEDRQSQFSMYFLDSTERFVYRYRSMTRALYELDRGTLRISPFPELNDPKEFADWKFGFAAQRSFHPEPNWPDLEQQTSAYAKKFAKVFCATLDDDSALDKENINRIWGRGFCRPRMLQQYADDYRGVCMVFDRATLDAAIIASVPEGSLHIADRVKYSDTPLMFKNHPTLNPFMLDYDIMNAVGLRQAMTEHIGLHREVLFFQKARDWRTEKEYRWLVWDTEHKDIIFKFGDALRAIVVGQKPSEEDLHRLHDACARVSIPVWQLRWWNGAPEAVPAIRPRR
jgi:hypothetical protein